MFLWHQNIKKEKMGDTQKQIVVGKNHDGSKIRKTVYGYTIEELEDNYLNLKLKHKQGIDLSQSSIPFGDYAFKWYKLYKSNKSAKTQEMYLNLINNHIDMIADMDITKIHNNDI